MPTATDDVRARIKGLVGKQLDQAFKSGDLQRMLEGRSPLGPDVGPGNLARLNGIQFANVPLINKVQAGYPVEFTDLGFPARTSHDHVAVPMVGDPDAFACRVVGLSMQPLYDEGDIVVFSPARAFRDGMDCFVRMEPDHESTFKRVFLEGAEGEEVIRLEALNPAFKPKRMPREMVAGMFPAMFVLREVS